MAEHLATAIVGLEVVLNRAVGDPRGWLGELLPGGAANPDLAEGFGNLYVSVAAGRYVARAGHYHYRQSEIFFTLTGTVLWAFRDYREGSATYGATQAVVLSDGEPPPGPGTAYRIGGQNLPGLLVPRGVYHVYWALSDEPARVVCVASTPHDDADYVRLDPKDVPGVPGLVQPYGVTLA